MPEEMPPFPQVVVPDASRTATPQPVMDTAPGEPGPLPHEVELEPNTQAPAAEGDTGAAAEAPTLDSQP